MFFKDMEEGSDEELPQAEQSETIITTSATTTTEATLATPAPPAAPPSTKKPIIVKDYNPKGKIKSYH